MRHDCSGVPVSSTTTPEPLSVESLTPRTSTYSTLRYELWKLESPEQSKSCLSLQLCIRRAPVYSLERVLSETRLLWSASTVRVLYSSYSIKDLRN